jgi:hypothetical protein
MRPTSIVEHDCAILRGLKKYIPRFDRYRVDRHKLIDAQIQTMRGGLTYAHIKKNWPTETDGDAQGAAQDARFWMDGGKIASPSESWQSLAVGQNLPPIKQALSK